MTQLTQNEAYQLIQEEKNLLNTLESKPLEKVELEVYIKEISEGKTSMWRTLAMCVAYIISLTSQLWTRAKTELEIIAAQSEPATDLWLAKMAREFRYKYDPLTNSNKYTLQVGDDNIPRWSDEALADEEALVIKYSAAETEAGICVIKACIDSGGLPAAINDTNLLDALSYYIDRIKPPGADVFVVSYNPDRITLNLQIFYNPLPGLPVIQAGVQAAITGYLNSLPFTGAVSLINLIDAIRAVPGAAQPVVIQAAGRQSTEAFSARVPFNRVYKTFAGAAVFDAANSNIHYIVLQ
jgi:hypothetical protein